MLRSPLPSFFWTHTVYQRHVKYLRPYASYSFLILRFICLSSSLIYFKNNTEYRTRERVQVSITLMTYLLFSLVSSSFLVLLRFSFFFFFVFHLSIIIILILATFFYINISWRHNYYYYSSWVFFLNFHYLSLAPPNGWVPFKAF